MNLNDTMEHIFTTAGIPCEKNVHLKYNTTMGIGGYAAWFVRPPTVESLLELKIHLDTCQQGYKIIGKGSNLIIEEKLLQQVIISLENMSGISLGDNMIVTAGAGAPLNRLCHFAAKNALAGLECAAGIPGTVGGAVAMNAGAFGWEIKDSLVSVIILNKNNQIDVYEKDALHFQYRKSCFAPEDIILTAEFQLQQKDAKSIQENIQLYQSRRFNNQPLTEKSSGCIFKNPPGNHAGKMIEEAGLKGYRKGGAVISEKHANFIVNRFNASFEDVMQLIGQIKETVWKRFSVELENEVIIWHS
ncbi:MAG: UDP-N-acetylenolpyruvoylglucosamine reductase [Candidatus Fischerbacteria bacterium RBG_13_37_8]|uniref:UDP-N-acetylenolpyruvoylglucosamine reductase n=1 Tax=Candidatus Fischerbacteria bacterium RBG_13_37_8 TaxID=1817863 RepID=A0A1F5VGA8_9BACT|nr:MAG: UDP-N-acetylenolpyruvoylglucosamine reductase [Candidatus Fischerbacteria bacterium RBG_13_37_8]